ncbi:MAG: Holliday junction branch migration protein RuvA [Lachnospiraceae bacterium]|nr:Holliday junction branch migration protein RuvA [Lachnospiraceae bacterium]MDY3990456.1 Holliday junction branch migration protein RuvA [Lachnospiraceae bacterium]
MISFIDGYIDEVSDGMVVIDHDGMGFEMAMSGNSISHLPIDHSQVRIYTLLNFNENTGFGLYGFYDKEERDFFRLLTGVSKVGPKAAMGVLSVLTPDELRLSVIAGDKKSIARAPGVGTKMAERIILELKDKIDVSDLASDEGASDEAVTLTASSVKNDALVALTGMGFSGKDVLDAMKKIDGAEDMTLETLLGETLRVLGSK